MALKRRRRGAGSDRRGRGGLFGALRSLVWLCMNLVFVGLWLGSIACAFYAYRITDDVVERFEGRRWKIPSRVYSDSLTLLPGDSLEEMGLVSRLERLNYRKIDTGEPDPGEYRLEEGELLVSLRDFSYPWEHAEGYMLSVEFRKGVITRLLDKARDRTLPAAEFEPELIARFFGGQQEDRDLVRYDEVSPYLKMAVVTVEDKRFYTHFGFDPIGFSRAMLTNLIRLRADQGGSTLTQQLVKNFYLSSERTITRKAKEAVMAFVLEMIYAKDAIFEAYLNEVYFAQEGSVSICGVGQASRYYFGKDVRGLGLADSALLAALIRSPAGYNPIKRMKRAKNRRDFIIQKMLDANLITKDQSVSAQAEEIKVLHRKPARTVAPYYIDFLRAKLEQRYGPDILISEGLRIFTTLDVTMQRNAEKAVSEGLAEIKEKYKKATDSKHPLQVAMVVIQPQTGFIRAMVGGRDYYKSQYNRAVQARRQVGSVFKPFVYAAGFLRAYQDPNFDFSPATMVLDEALQTPLDGKKWKPRNYGGKYHGLILLRRALEKSLNVATAKLAMKVGISRIENLAHAIGVTSKLPPYPSLSLGSGELSPLEVAGAYGTLANLGTWAQSLAIRDVVDRKGRVLEKKPVEIRRVLPPPVAFLTTSLLEGVVNRGTGVRVRSMGFRHPCAGKTGTTNDFKDAWFVGYTPKLLAAVWVGFDDHARSLGLPGSKAALPIWTKFMLAQVAKGAPTPFSPPEGIVRKKIDPTTGKLFVYECPDSIDEYFLEGREPTEECEKHKDPLLEFFKKKF